MLATIRESRFDQLNKARPGREISENEEKVVPSLGFLRRTNDYIYGSFIDKRLHLLDRFRIDEVATREIELARQIFYSIHTIKFESDNITILRVYDTGIKFWNQTYLRLVQLRTLKASAKHFDAKKEVFKGLALLLKIDFAEFSQVLKPRQRQQLIHDIKQIVLNPPPFQITQRAPQQQGGGEKFHDVK